jgi:hypothetical protein
VPPDYAWVHTELKRHGHVTLQLLWEEYVERHVDAAYRRSAFCQGYRRWERSLKRQARAGLPYLPGTARARPAIQRAALRGRTSPGDAHLGSPTRKSVKSILESGRDLRPPSATEPLALELPPHGNVRGPGYYH